jgi:hypothetical protein
MNQTSGTKVFIPGAGCSVDCGYPLGKRLASQLEEFQTEISGHFPIIEKCVRETINLAKEFPQFDTLDQLTQGIEENYKRWAQQQSIGASHAISQKEILCDMQITNAKIAVSTMFLNREQKARETGLNSYVRFIASLFGGGKRNEVMRSAPNCHVLSFNYDRMFEVAFLKYFQGSDFSSVSFYGNQVLNSGFNHRVNGGFDKVELATGKFSFLKLHGSSGWWVKKNLHQTEQRYYWPPAPTNSVNLQGSEDLLKKNGIYSSETLNNPNGAAFPWEALITLPHEKQCSLENRRFGFSYNPYICAVWDHAANLLVAATEVKIIGYSFSAIDSRHMVETLLNRATQCEKIVIQNPAVKNVRAALASCAQLNGRLKFDVSSFGENLSTSCPVSRWGKLFNLK